MCSITWWHFQWPWVTPNLGFKVTGYLQVEYLISSAELLVFCRGAREICKNIYKKVREVHISPYCLVLVTLNFMKFGIRGQLTDVSTYVKFLLDRFRGHRVLTPQNCHFPLTCCVALTTVYALPCDTVKGFSLKLKGTVVCTAVWFTGSETWTTKKELKIKLDRTEVSMLGWMVFWNSKKRKENRNLRTVGTGSSVFSYQDYDGLLNMTMMPRASDSAAAEAKKGL